MRRYIVTIIKYAGLWGLTEVTLGYLLHLAGYVSGIRNVAGAVMFPIGLFFILLAYRETGRESSILLTGIFAGFIKLVNLFFPFLPPGETINPAVAIVFESAILLAGIRLLKPFKPFLYVPAISVLWRGIFLLFLFLSPVSKGILNRGTATVIYFLFVEGLISGLIGGMVYRIVEIKRLDRISLSPFLSSVFFTLAIVLQMSLYLLKWMS